MDGRLRKHLSAALLNQNSIIVIFSFVFFFLFLFLFFLLDLAWTIPKDRYTGNSRRRSAMEAWIAERDHNPFEKGSAGRFGSIATIKSLKLIISLKSFNYPWHFLYSGHSCMGRQKATHFIIIHIAHIFITKLNHSLNQRITSWFTNIKKIK